LVENFTQKLKNPKHENQMLHRLVFPIPGKVLKPKFWVAEKRNLGKPVFWVFEMNAILKGKTQYHCEITAFCPSAIY